MTFEVSSPEPGGVKPTRLTDLAASPVKAIPANDPEILAEVRTILVWKRSASFPAEMAQVLVQLRRENAELRAAKDAAVRRVGEWERAAVEALRGPYRPQPCGYDANGSEVGL